MPRALSALAVACALSLGSAACARPSPPARAAQLVRLGREAEAITLLRAELAKRPDDVASRRMLVRVLALSGDLDGARREVDRLRKELPGDPVPLVELGHAYEIAHRFEDALAAYDAAAAEAETNPLGPREGGMRAARWGEHEAALPRLEEAVRRGARDAETYHALGLVRVHARDLRGADAAYRAGLAADPRSHENLLGLATVAVVRDDPEGALAAYDRLLAAEPTFAPAELGRAWALTRLGRSQEATTALDHARTLGTPAETVERQRAKLAELGRAEASPLTPPPARRQ